MEKTDLLIIGSGPAGYTAAIYASRAGLNPILYQGNQPGGQLTITNDVENFPGFPEGINGSNMMIKFGEQATRFGADVRNGVITSVDFSDWPYKMVADDKQPILAKSVIISTGASAKWLGLESEKKLNGKGVSACAVCDGFFYRNQDVIVVGGGDVAAEEATYLSKITNKVYLLVRKDYMRASLAMQKKVLNTTNIELFRNTTTLEILGDEAVTGARVINTQTQEEKIIPASGFFVAVGHKPNTDIFKNWVKLDTNGYIVTEKGSCKTNVRGVFVAGDAQDYIYRQAITAAGSGCMAALDVERFLKTL